MGRYFAAKFASATATKCTTGSWASFCFRWLKFMLCEESSSLQFKFCELWWIPTPHKATKMRTAAALQLLDKTKARFQQGGLPRAWCRELHIWTSFRLFFVFTTNLIDCITTRQAMPSIPYSYRNNKMGLLERKRCKVEVEAKLRSSTNSYLHSL